MRNKNVICDKLSSKLEVTDRVRFDFWSGSISMRSSLLPLLVLHPYVRTKLAESTEVIKNNLLLVAQSKAFCAGPATFGKLKADLPLTGSVIQT